MYIRILSKPVGEEGIRYDAIKDNSKLYFNQRHCHRRNGFRDFSGIQKTVLLIPDRIFERFYCGDRARSTPQSSGLRLAIVKRIVELHEGEVDVSLQGQELSVHLFLK